MAYFCWTEKMLGKKERLAFITFFSFFVLLKNSGNMLFVM